MKQDLSLKIEVHDQTIGKVLQNHSYFALFKLNPNLLGSFLKNPPDGVGHGPKYVKSKNRHHSQKPTFYDKRFCFYTDQKYLNFKGP